MFLHTTVWAVMLFSGYRSMARRIWDACYSLHASTDVTRLQQLRSAADRIFSPSRACLAAFLGAAAAPDQFVTGDVAEVAFVGRSNVGKSSLINAIFGSSKLCRTSQTPGRTQQINFFAPGVKANQKMGKFVGHGSWETDGVVIVDLPGYGFAKAPLPIVSAWNSLIRAYLLKRGVDTLKRVFVLIDVRRGIMDKDLAMLQLLQEHGMPFQVVLTKCDKVGVGRVETAAKHVAQLTLGYSAAVSPVLCVSSHLRHGVRETQMMIVEAAALHEPSPAQMKRVYTYRA